MGNTDITVLHITVLMPIPRERTELWLAYGPPEAVIEKIHTYLDAGCTTPVLRFVAPNLHDQLQRCIAEECYRLFALPQRQRCL